MKIIIIVFFVIVSFLSNLEVRAQVSDEKLIYYEVLKNITKVVDLRVMYYSWEKIDTFYNEQVGDTNFMVPFYQIGQKPPDFDLKCDTCYYVLEVNKRVNNYTGMSSILDTFAFSVNNEIRWTDNINTDTVFPIEFIKDTNLFILSRDYKFSEYEFYSNLVNRYVYNYGNISLSEITFTNINFDKSRKFAQVFVIYGYKLHYIFLKKEKYYWQIKQYGFAANVNY